MAGLLSRRGFLAGLGGGSALAALGTGGLVAPASAQAFNWKKHAGAKLRVVTLKFPLSEIQQARLADFEQLTGIKVQWEMLPEDLWRQKVKVEHLGGATDLDVFLSYYAQEGKQFLTSGWYTDMRADDAEPRADQPGLRVGRLHPHRAGWGDDRGAGPDHPRPRRDDPDPLLPSRPLPAVQARAPEDLAGRAQRRQDHLRGHQQAGVRDRPPRQGGGRHVDVRPRPLRFRRTVVRPRERRRRRSTPRRRWPPSSGGAPSCASTGRQAP